jgi:eukaryotic-like serine/threonine-protein kinase
LKAASPLIPSLADPQIGPGHVLDRYELLMPIAAGGMAMVWAARLKGTRGFQKIFAVKTMLPYLVDDDQFEQMFLDEASLASKIRHPNAVEIIDLGEQNGVLFLAMEWIDGVPLHHLMKVAKRHGGVPTTVATRIVMQACAGLHAAHELTDGKGKLIGLVHRDISPQNILVTFSGVAKVVDFGVAKATALGEGTTRAGLVKGKIGYMAPEQGRGEAIDRRADVFAMGIVLYALTTGQHPFRKESDGATLFAITSDDPVVPPRKLVPSYPATLERVVLKALEKDRDKRFGSARELFNALDKALPLHTRGSDEEVGAFVTGLFAEQRQKSQAALADALERADRNQLSELRSSPYSMAPPSSPQSGVNSVSSAGVTARIVPPSPLPPPSEASQTGKPDQSSPSPPSSQAAPSKGRLAQLWTLAAKWPRRVVIPTGVGLVVALVAGSLWLWGGDGDPAALTMKPAQWKLTADQAIQAVSQPAEARVSVPEAPPTPSDVAETPESSSSSALPAASAVPSSGKRLPLPLSSSRPPAATKKPWKHDPGF